VPAGSLGFWQNRLTALRVTTWALETRFGEPVLPFADPDGMRLELVFTAEADSRPPAPSPDVTSDVAIRGFHSSTLALTSEAATAALLTDTMGYRLVGRENHRARYTTATGGPGTYVDLLTDPALPRGLNGAGTVHHIAFRVADDAEHLAAHDLLAAGGFGVSPVIDRAYFKSIYYREPAGVLFEIATDQPGFAIDEPVESLGTILSLPPRLEPHRAEIEAILPKLN
jgi:glyoxalase family protein